MRAVTTTGPGGPDVLVVSEVADPEPAPGEVVIEVAAAGVNRADLLQRMGYYPPPPGASPLLGLECSGTVAESPAEGPADVPADVPAVGSEVCALLSGGGYAQRVAVPAGQVMPVPVGVDLITAAGLPEVACTVYSNLTMVGDLQPGEWVLIHGGGGGIGTFAIQWARSLGARVAVTAGSPEKLAVCADLGAEVLIDYRHQDFADVMRDATGGHGADVILDVMGAKYLAANVATLARWGRLVVIGLQGGVKAELNLNALLTRQASIHATSLRSLPIDRKAEICAGVVRDVWPLVADGRIRPVVDRVLPMAAVADAHQLMADSGHVGKILLRVAP